MTSPNMSRLSLSIVSAAFLIAGFSRADEPTPLLVQLDQETQALYRNVQQGVARVQLPTPRWLKTDLAAEDPTRTWNQLSSKMRETLQLQANQYHRVIPYEATTQPANESAEWPTELSGNGQVFRSNGTTAIQITTGGTRAPNGTILLNGSISFQPATGFTPNNVGLVTDQSGHLLVPLYVEKDDVPDGVKVAMGSGHVVTADFVSSDRPSMLSVFKLPESTGKPVKVGVRRPAEGSLVMTISPDASASHLILWSGDKTDVSGVIVSVDGAVSGFARGGGQFVSLASCKGVLDELVRYGKVKRATLGMTVVQVVPHDALRERWAELGTQPAIKVQNVDANSIGAKGGIQNGDLILTFAGEDVGDPNELASVLAGRTGATQVKLLRDGKPLDLTLVLPAE